MTHLVLNELKLAAAGEWECRADAWLLVRLASGLGYWRSEDKECQEVSQDDTLLLFPSARGTMLASRVGDVTLQVFAIDLQLLSGVLTLRESKALTAFALHNHEKVLLLPRNHAFSVRFAEICRIQRPNTLLSRLKLLQLFAELLGESSRAESGTRPKYTDGRSRLQELLRQIPEAELMHSSVPDLAKRLSFSRRHFSRLFHEEIGTSLRNKQQELRLERARHLLEQSHEGIAQIALDVGYKSLGLFNVLFKRRFAMTPSQWRIRNRTGKKHFHEAQPPATLLRTEATNCWTAFNGGAQQSAGA